MDQNGQHSQDLIGKCGNVMKRKKKFPKPTEEEFGQAKIMFEAKLIAGEARPVDFGLSPYKYSSWKRVWCVLALVLRFFG